MVPSSKTTARSRGSVRRTTRRLARRVEAASTPSSSSERQRTRSSSRDRVTEREAIEPDVAGEGPARGRAGGVEGGPGLEPERPGAEAERGGPVGVGGERRQVEAGRLERQLALAGEGADRPVQPDRPALRPAERGGERAGHGRIAPQPLELERPARRARGAPAAGPSGPRRRPPARSPTPTPPPSATGWARAGRGGSPASRGGPWSRRARGEG